MNISSRAWLATALMSIGLAALIVDGVDEGWSALGIVGVACFTVAIAAQLLQLRQHESS
jgi:membrane-bound ClpP family serine protease